jgi:hypothetical protein
MTGWSDATVLAGSVTVKKDYLGGRPADRRTRATVAQASRL